MCRVRPVHVEVTCVLKWNADLRRDQVKWPQVCSMSTVSGRGWVVDSDSHGAPFTFLKVPTPLQFCEYHLNMSFPKRTSSE